MDLLRYSALKEQGDVVACNSGLPTSTNGIVATTLPAVQSACWYAYKERIQNAPWCTVNWAGISTMPANVNTTPGSTNSLCVIDRTSGVGASYRCGASCVFTVPAGAALARFQIWGAGAGSGSGCCCGGSNFGGTGAYASIIIPVTPGDQYNLCAGCAPCCYACRPGTYQSCASYVTGPRLCTFCAEGGCLGHCIWLACVHPGCSNKVVTNCWGGVCGPSVCNTGGDFCAYSTPNSGSTITYVAAPNTFYGCATNGTPAQGMNGMWGCLCSSNYGQILAKHPPVYGFENVSQCQLNPAANGIIGGQLCYRADQIDFMRIPAAGGAVSNPCGGCNTPNSDSGRAGMVCVTWW